MDNLKTLLRDKAEEMRLDPEMPAGLKTRARRRRISNAVLSGVIVIGIGAAAFAGARQLVDGRDVPGPKPVQQPPAGTTQELLPIWPTGEAKEIDRIQQEVDEGHQPWYLSPEIVGQVFAMDILGWEREQIEVSVRGDDPVTVAISNPTLAEAAGAPADLRTILTMVRWQGREDGIFVVMAAFSDVIDLSTPRPFSSVPSDGTVSFFGSLGFVPRDGSVFIELASSNEALDSEFAASDIFDTALRVRNVEAPVRAAITLMDASKRALAYAAFPLAGGVEEGGHAIKVVLGPPPAGEPLPQPVERSRGTIQFAAYHREWDTLRSLIPETGFTFSFGGSEDPIAYWQELEDQGEPVLAILFTLLQGAPAEFRDGFSWPAPAVKAPEEWTEEDLTILREVSSEREIRDYQEYGSYLGWRVGIEADGDWIFFVAGD